jgi:hypothetical protein
MADTDVVDIEAVDPAVPDLPDEPEDDRPVHFADGAYENMAMGVVDEQPSLAHFTKCGLQVGDETSIRVTDNTDDVTCEACL